MDTSAAEGMVGRLLACVGCGVDFVYNLQQVQTWSAVVAGNSKHQ
jgi:hypothetical protein